MLEKLNKTFYKCKKCNTKKTKQEKPKRPKKKTKHKDSPPYNTTGSFEPFHYFALAGPKEELRSIIVNLELFLELLQML